MSLDVDMDNPIFGRGNPRNLSALAPPVKAGLIADAAKMLMAAFPDWATVFKYSNGSSG